MGQILMKRNNKGEEYIKAYPKLKKWINECLYCHKKGYNPSIPDKITTVDGSLEVYYIKKYFQPLSLDKNGLCLQCAKIFTDKN